MRITMHENEVLKAISKCYPVKSSFAKLTKETGKARNEIEEIANGLKRIGYVNITVSNEIYLIDDGRKYLGISSNKPESSKAIYSASKPGAELPAKEPGSSQPVNTDNDFPTEQHPVLASIDDLGEELNKPTLVIQDFDLKGQALTKLAALMSDDISELLLNIKRDLERAAA